MSLLVALTIAGALFQSPVAPAGAAVSGHVADAGSGAPIAGVRLMLMPSRPGRFPFENQRTAVTDDNGRYVFDGLEPGRYRLNIEKAGYAAPGPLDVPELSLAAGERLENVNVTLQKGAVIVGRVVDEAGEPVTDALVMAVRRLADRDVRAAGTIPSGPGAQTNDLGEFRLFSLLPGEYYVQAMPRPEFRGSPAPRATTMLPTYFPGTPDFQAAHPVSLGAGQTSAEVVIRMIAVPAFQVAGVVVDEAGRPVANAMVKLVSDQPAGGLLSMMAGSSHSRTDASGRFTINNVTNGTYTLLAIAPHVISAPTGRRSGARTEWSGGAVSLGAAVGAASSGPGGGVVTETSSSGTIEYRDDAGTRVPVAINQANVSGVEVVVRRSR